MTGGYIAHMRVTDYGPYIVKLILPLHAAVKAAQIHKRKFNVYTERLDKDGCILSLPKSWMAPDDKEPSCGYVPVQDAYVSDRNGTAVKTGSYVTLCLPYGPSMQLTAAICAPDGMNIYITNAFTITQTESIKTGTGTLTGLTWDRCLETVKPDLEGWLYGKAAHPTTPIHYGYYVPETTQVKKPLIIWLHGAGEGGYDPRIPFSANKVVAMAKPDIQQYFGGAYIFAPQCETFWMNDGTGTYGRSGHSIYEDALFSAIEYFVDRHTDIDKDRIYIGGDSNGGFMTVRMVLNHPDYFAAAFPTCEALYDEVITDEEIEGVKHLPMWFTHSKDDPVVSPSETVVPTVARLRKAGAPVHFSFWNGIYDIHEGFTGADGKPHRYLGHFAWIPVFNNDCRLEDDDTPVTVDGREVSLMEWLSLQHR